MQLYEKLDSLMISNEYKLNESDKCIDYNYESNIYTIICPYLLKPYQFLFGVNPPVLRRRKKNAKFEIISSFKHTY